MSKLTPPGQGSEATAVVKRRCDYCFTCYHCAKNVSVSLWDVETGTIHKTYSFEAGNVTRHGDGKAVNIAVLGSSYLLCAPRAVPFIYVWNLTKEQLQLKISCCGLLNALSCSPDQNYCAGAIEEKIYIWQVYTGHLVAVVSQHYQVVNVLKFTDDGTYLLSGGADARVLVWKFNSVLFDAYTEGGNLIPYASSINASTGSRSSLTRHVWSDHSLSVMDIHCGSGGLRCRVATASLDQTCKLYELSSGRLLCSFLFSCGLTAVTMDVGEHWLFVGGINGSILQINLFTQQHCNSHHLSGKYSRSCLLFNGHSKPITKVTVGRLSHNLISSSEEDSVKVWDIASRQVLRTLKVKGPVHDMFLTGCDLSPLLQQLSYRSYQRSQSIQPFHKQLYFASLKEEDSRQKGMRTTTMAPITVHTTDPLCDLRSQVEYNCLYSLPITSLFIQNEALIAIQTLKQEISEVKDVHKRLYDFLMDSVADTK